jgi:ketosteroid isomerase-like protein
MGEGLHSRHFRKMLEEAARVSQGADMGGWLDLFTEDVEWVSLEDAPDAGTYIGHDGIRSYFEDWLGTVDDIHWEIGELREIGDSLVAEATFKAKVKGTENEMVFSYWMVVRFDDGQLSRLKEFRDRASAFSFAAA